MTPSRGTLSSPTKDTDASSVLVEGGGGDKSEAGPPPPVVASALATVRGLRSLLPDLLGLVFEGNLVARWEKREERWR